MALEDADFPQKTHRTIALVLGILLIFVGVTALGASGANRSFISAPNGNNQQGYNSGKVYVINLLFVFSGLLHCATGLLCMRVYYAKYHNHWFPARSLILCGVLFLIFTIVANIIPVTVAAVLKIIQSNCYSCSSTLDTTCSPNAIAAGQDCWYYGPKFDQYMFTMLLSTIFIAIGSVLQLAVSILGCVLYCERKRLAHAEATVLIGGAAVTKYDV